MRGRSILLSSLVLTLFLLVGANSVSAHVPTFSDEHTGIDSAVTVNTPTKSWVLYGELDGPDDVSYYKMKLDKGERLRLVLFSTEKDYNLSAVVMGPGISTEGVPPDFVETLNGTGVQVVHGERPDSAEFEPFTPGSYYYFVDYNQELNVSGTYYVAVYSTAGEGKYGMAVGYEETFSFTEWVRVPLDAIRIHLWEGQNIVVILLPLILTVALGLFVMVWLKPEGRTLPLDEQWRVLAALAGLVYVGTGFMMLHQLFRAASIGPTGGSAIVTLLFASIPLILGGIMLNISLDLETPLTRRKRFRLVLLAAMGLFMWGGIMVGPVLAAIAAFSPAKRPPPADTSNITNTTK